MQQIKVSQATASLRRVYFDAVDSTNPLTPRSAAEMGIGGAGAFTVRISKNGGASATAGTVTEIDATNMKGLFYVEFSQVNVDTGGSLVINISTAGGAANMLARRIVVEITAIDNQVATDIAVWNALVVAGGTSFRKRIEHMSACLYGQATDMDDGTTIFRSPDNAAQNRVTALQNGDARANPTLDNTGI